MDKKLEILWEGKVPGLSEHRLSLEAFGEALVRLHAAYRRIASNLLATADSSTGRLHSLTSLFDLQLEKIVEGSAGIVAACAVDPAWIGTGLEDLPGAAVDILLSDIAAEARGEQRNPTVGKYLRSLPQEVTGQKYRYTGNGRDRELSIGSMSLPERIAPMPTLQDRLCAIVAVGFEPGERYVRFKSIEEAPINCTATAEQVTQALELRHGSVRALFVRHGRKARLLRMRKAGEEMPPLTPEQEEYLVFGKWESLLRRLAE
jgi:hypothetical protein